MKLTEVYRCLCDETRLRMVHLLTHGPLCVCHFQEILQLPQVAVSKHLAYLRQHGLVEKRRHQQWMIYFLPDEPPPELAAHLRCLEECAGSQPTLCGDLQRLEKRRRCCEWVRDAFATATPVRGRKTVVAA